jgi:hypothetical protein
MSHATESFPVSPNAVYVWRGFKPAAHTYEAFASFLGTVFVPACVLLQPLIGLRAYLPCMVPQEGKPPAVPDQTALMFWRDENAHDEAKAAIACRIYSNLHGDVYDMTRSTLPEVPMHLTVGTPLTSEQPYYLLDGDADWMLGAVQHLVGARPEAQTPAQFLAAVQAWAEDFVSRPDVALDGALLCCGNDYLAAWVHAADATSALEPTLAPLASLTTPVLQTAAQPTALPGALWDAWPHGLDLIAAPSCLNMQFERPVHAAPKPIGPTAA